MTLTTAQKMGLRYYETLTVQDKAAKMAALRGLHAPDPRTQRALSSKGLIAPRGECYGAVFSITDAGRYVLAQ